MTDSFFTYKSAQEILVHISMCVIEIYRHDKI